MKNMKPNDVADLRRTTEALAQLSVQFEVTLDQEEREWRSRSDIHLYERIRLRRACMQHRFKRLSSRLITMQTTGGTP